MEPIEEEKSRMEKQNYLQNAITTSGINGAKFYQYLQSLRGITIL